MRVIRFATTHTTTFGQHRLGRESGLLPATQLVRSFDSTDSMFIRIGYDIALRFPVPTTVIHLLHVHPARRTDLVEPQRLSIAPLSVSRNIVTDSLIIARASVRLQGQFVFSARRLSATAANSIRINAKWRRWLCPKSRCTIGSRPLGSNRFSMVAGSHVEVSVQKIVEILKSKASGGPTGTS